MPSERSRFCNGGGSLYVLRGCRQRCAQSLNVPRRMFIRWGGGGGCPKTADRRPRPRVSQAGRLWTQPAGLLRRLIPTAAAAVAQADSFTMEASVGSVKSVPNSVTHEEEKRDLLRGKPNGVALPGMCPWDGSACVIVRNPSSESGLWILSAGAIINYPLG